MREIVCRNHYLLVGWYPQKKGRSTIMFYFSRYNSALLIYIRSNCAVVFELLCSIFPQCYFSVNADHERFWSDLV
jgi:hypothetical protein